MRIILNLLALAVVVSAFVAFRAYDRIECPVVARTISYEYDIVSGEPIWRATTTVCSEEVPFRLSQIKSIGWDGDRTTARRELEARLPEIGETINVSRRQIGLMLWRMENP